MPSSLIDRDRKWLEKQEKTQSIPPYASSCSGLPDVLSDLGERRIAKMDEAGIDIQVLSLSGPIVERMESAESVKYARMANDFVGEAIKKFHLAFPVLQYYQCRLLKRHLKSLNAQLVIWDSREL